MFAYCLNNPVNRSDISGTVSLWYYLIADHDMGFVHRAVVSHIQKNYNVRTEVPLSKYGRADIVLESAVWEVKHAGSNPLQRMFIAFAEACGYVLINDELNALGMPLMFNNTIYISCEGSSYAVEYCTPFPGVVLYTVKEDPNYNGEYSAVFVPKSKRTKEESSNKTGISGLIGAPFTFGGATGGGLIYGFDKQNHSLI